VTSQGNTQLSTKDRNEQWIGVEVGKGMVCQVQGTAVAKAWEGEGKHGSQDALKTQGWSLLLAWPCHWRLPLVAACGPAGEGEAGSPAKEWRPRAQLLPGDHCCFFASLLRIQTSPGLCPFLCVT
jgi:hypothetical protein